MDVLILGRNIKLTRRDKSTLKGINIGESIGYTFYEGVFHGVKLLFLKPRKDNPSPRNCELTGKRLSERFGLPVVFILNPAPSYERQRLVDKDVFFIMGDKFANLPMLVANERVRRSAPARRLTPVAQYILLYHLQVESLEGLSAKEMADSLPYSYESVTLGLTCLTDVALAEKISNGTKTKVIHFLEKGLDLWHKAQPYLIDPIEKRVFCDELITEEPFPQCNINALAHYSRLNPDDGVMLMMSRKQLSALQNAKAIVNPNGYDGRYMIEVWKYPAVAKRGEATEWVDKLSLVTSLEDEEDARVEGEVERIINEMQWTD